MIWRAHPKDTTMNHSTRLAAVLVCGRAVTACSDDAQTADPVAFCALGQDIQTATASIDRPEAAVTTFQELAGTIDELVAAAPADVAEQATEFDQHVTQAVETGDFAAFDDGTVDELTARMDAICSTQTDE
jgi:hypothetical protein